VANKWLEALKAKNAPHNTATASREAPTRGPVATGEITDTPKNPVDKIDRNEGKPKKKTKKKKLSPEETVDHYDRLAQAFPAYVHTKDRASECLVWVSKIPEVCLDIETYGPRKRDGLLYTRCQVRMILLHYAGESYFLDCDHVADEMIVSILRALVGKPKYLHNAMFDIPRLYRRFGVLLDQNIHDTLIASRVARAGEWVKKGLQGHPNLPRFR
jgi:3'-5' exonuclease